MKRTFEEGWRSDGRKPVLWIIQGGKVYRFAGASIPGVVQVLEAWQVKGAKGYARVMYDLDLADGAKACELLAFMSKRLWPEASLKEAFARFKKQYDAAKLSERMFVAALKRDFPLAYARLAHGEEAPNSVDWEWSSRQGKK